MVYWARLEMLMAGPDVLIPLVTADWAIGGLLLPANPNWAQRVTVHLGKAQVTASTPALSEPEPGRCW